MSRSYKAPVWKDRPGKRTKRASSKSIRRWLKGLDFGFKSSKQFKHQINQYDLIDWIYHPTDMVMIEKAKRK